MADPVLVLDNLHKSFGALRATDGVDLELRHGEIHALIGPNGAGKSTLINLTAGAIRPDSGAVRFLGRDVTALSVAARAKAGLARTFQVSSVVGEFSALANVGLAVQARLGGGFGLLKRVRGDAAVEVPARDALQRAGLGDRAEVPAGELSHGERRRLELAIALAAKPKVLLLDEPMAGLGPEGAAALTDFLRELKDSVAILLVEHDMDAVFSLADRITVLDYGRVIAAGSVDDIRNHPEVRRAYLGDDDDGAGHA